MAVALVVAIIAQLTDPAGNGRVLLLAPAVAAFGLRGELPRLPDEVFAMLVILPVAAAVGQHGELEGSFFLVVLMVLLVAWSQRSLGRSAAIALVASLVPWLCADQLVPSSGIGWTPWATANAFVLLMGRVLRRQDALIHELAEARQALADQAVAEERRRVARELHDLAGHTLAAVLLHVTGARHVLRRDLDDAERALRDAESVGRSSLDQIRATVAALRADESGTDAALAGSPDLPALVDQYRRAGLSVSADIGAEAAHIEGPVGTALHRIAREALANVARHAPSNQVEVVLAATDSHVRVVVADRGRPGLAPDPGLPHFGLIGMAERARALGGELEAGPTAEGWRVEAVLPLVGSRSRAGSP